MIPPSNGNMNPAGAIPVNTVPYGYTPLGYQQMTNLAAPVPLAPPAGATFAVITVSVAPVRYRDDGQPPTATTGMPVTAGTTFTYSGPLAMLEFVQQTAGAVLDISFYK